MWHALTRFNDLTLLRAAQNAPDGGVGGMVFGMRDSMAAGSATLGAAAGVGALFGLVVVMALKVYDLAIRGPVVDTGERTE